MFTMKWDLGNDWSNSLKLFKDGQEFAELLRLTGEEDQNGEWHELIVSVSSSVKFHESCQEHDYPEGKIYDCVIYRQPTTTEETDEQMLRKACQLAFGFDPGPPS